MEGNLHFKVSWASLTLGRKFTVFLCFTLYKFGGLLFGGAYLQNFTGLIFRRSGGVVRKVWCIKTLPLPPKINDMKNII